MKKLFFFIPVIFLIFATTVTKNSTKQLDKKIFEMKENLRVCISCNYHFRMSAEDRIKILFVNEELNEIELENINDDPL